MEAMRLSNIESSLAMSCFEFIRRGGIAMDPVSSAARECKIQSAKKAGRVLSNIIPT